MYLGLVFTCTGSGPDAVPYERPGHTPVLPPAGLGFPS